MDALRIGIPIAGRRCGLQGCDDEQKLWGRTPRHGPDGTLRNLLDTGSPWDSIICRSRDEVDLTDSGAVRTVDRAERIDEVHLAAARVGGT
jgi:hypothetical protein